MNGTTTNGAHAASAPMVTNFAQLAAIEELAGIEAEKSRRARGADVASHEDIHTSDQTPRAKRLARVIAEYPQTTAIRIGDIHSLRRGAQKNMARALVAVVDLTHTDSCDPRKDSARAERAVAAIALARDFLDAMRDEIDLLALLIDTRTGTRST